MDRYAPGVYKVSVPAGTVSYNLYIDNKRINVEPAEKFTCYVVNNMYHDTGKVAVTYVGDNIKNISGAVSSWEQDIMVKKLNVGYIKLLKVVHQWWEQKED